MHTFYDAVSADIPVGSDRGSVTLGVPVPWGIGSGVTVKRSRVKGGERMNVVIDRIDGNTLHFNVPRDNIHFTRPDFSHGPWVVKGSE